jgi:hypothetical protein
MPPQIDPDLEEEEYYCEDSSDDQKKSEGFEGF